MLFTSFSFLQFLPIVLLLYWSLYKFRKAQNILLLVASYVFYGWWNWKFCALLLFSSSFGFFVASQIQQTKSERKRTELMVLSAVVHLGILCYFKYFNFFISSFVDFADMLGWQLNYMPLHIVLPLAISFFTFHVLGYTVDVYQGTYKAADDYIDFITHIAFFPQLVAGPIERAGHLLPQFTNPRTFSWAKMEDGLSQMLWGFFKKTVIADSIAQYVNYVYQSDAGAGGSNVVLATAAFTIQVYCDFSGYSDIALGTARMMGFELLKNFNFPYFSTSLTEFWRRWHISLSTWITDYLYMPISFSRRRWGKWGIVFAAIISFTISGLWHGAHWPAIIWGLMNGVVIGYEVLTRDIRKRWSETFPKVFYSVFSALLVWAFWALSQLVFRSGSLKKFVFLWDQICSASLFTMPYYAAVQNGLGWGLLMLLIEWFQRKRAYGMDMGHLNYMIRWSVYAVVIMIIFSSHNLNNQNEFIYFQF